MERDGAFRFSERFLQILWNERHLLAGLRCEDGRRLQVLSPGLWNAGGGPDFHQAQLLLDGHVVRGDVEVHCASREWERHRHGEDSAYQDVVLHVVWEDNGGTPPQIPVLVLRKVLLPDWQVFLEMMEASWYSRAREIPAGDCALRWALTEDNEMHGLLRASGLARFSAKGGVFARGAVEIGKEQALYEAIFDCLGYRENRVAFRLLSHQLPLSELKALPDDEAREAVLFGQAGLLPDMTQETLLPEWRVRVRSLWDHWWKYRREVSPLPWSTHAMRPYNTPWRRLAAGISLLQAMEYAPCQWLQRCAASSPNPKEFLRRLTEACLTPEEWHGLRDFTRTIVPPAELLGRTRQTELFANILLPFLFGISGEETQEGRLARESWLLLPAGQENRLCREAELRFFQPPSRGRELIRSGAAQQGLLNIYQNFCLALGNDCAACPLSGGR